MKFIIPALVMFGAAKIGQDVAIRPAAIALLRPAVIVGGVSAYIDHRVDRTAAAEKPPLRQIHAAPVHVALRFGFETPDEARTAETDKRRRNLHVEMAVGAARLQNQHADGGVGGKPRGEHGAARAGPDDHVIVHRSSLRRAGAKRPLAARDDLW